MIIVKSFCRHDTCTVLIKIWLDLVCNEIQTSISSTCINRVPGIKLLYRCPFLVTTVEDPSCEAVRSDGASDHGPSSGPSPICKELRIPGHPSPALHLLS